MLLRGLMMFPRIDGVHHYIDESNHNRVDLSTQQRTHHNGRISEHAVREGLGQHQAPKT